MTLIGPRNQEPRPPTSSRPQRQEPMSLAAAFKSCLPPEFKTDPEPQEVSQRLGETVTFPLGTNDGDPEPGRGIGLIFKGIFSSPWVE